ncbi:MAG: hypothetical protein PHW34_14065 [Hespellia sp.]|nr:hypothetical protein [Hespellia sp.]
MKVKDLVIGSIYYVTNNYNCKQCFKVELVEIINDTTVSVVGLTRSKKTKKEPTPFRINIAKLHVDASKAVHGYRQHHKQK